MSTCPDATQTHDQRFRKRLFHSVLSLFLFFIIFLSLDSRVKNTFTAKSCLSFSGCVSAIPSSTSVVPTSLTPTFCISESLPSAAGHGISPLLLIHLKRGANCNFQFEENELNVLFFRSVELNRDSRNGLHDFVYSELWIRSLLFDGSRVNSRWNESPMKQNENERLGV